MIRWSISIQVETHCNQSCKLSFMRANQVNSGTVGGRRGRSPFVARIELPGWLNERLAFVNDMHGQHL
jgi:hypothetical protein